ncbi:MAG TPA: CdaR family protein [Candidatus Binatia bacterium]|nr:CdaR family protein [Candidatus Binatia bacterium]
MRLPVLRPRPDTVAPGDEPRRRRRVPLPSWRALREGLRRNPGLKLLSLVLATLLWFTINLTERDAERLVELPLSIRKLQPGLIVTNPPVRPIAMTLRGPRTILDGVDERKERIALDLAGIAPGDTRIELNTDMIRPELPRRVKVVRMEPARLTLRVDRLARRTVPVHAELAGAPALGYTVAESQVVPDHVEVTGPAGKVDELKEVTTEPIDLRGLKDTLQRNVLLAWAGDFVSFAPDHVVVSVTFEEVMVSRDFRHVEVGVLHAEGFQVQVRPAAVDLTVRGPQRLFHNFKLAAGGVYVDAAGLGPGRHTAGVHVELPPGLELLGDPPEVQLTLTAAGTEP